MQANFQQTRVVLTKQERIKFDFVRSFLHIEGDYSQRLANVFIKGAFTEVARNRRKFAVRSLGLNDNV